MQLIGATWVIFTSYGATKAMMMTFCDDGSQATKKHATKPLTESDIREISDVLKRGSRETWSHIPRIYSVLWKRSTSYDPSIH
jgi:hypothetical protein